MSKILKMKESDLSWQEPVLEALPQEIQDMIRGVPLSLRQDLEEIRIRENRPLMVHGQGKDYFVCKDGSISPRAEQAYHINQEDTRKILQLISDYSIYAFDEDIFEGDDDILCPSCNEVIYSEEAYDSEDDE